MDNRKKIASLNTQLFEAITKNQSSKIEQLIKDGAQLDEVLNKEKPIELASRLEHWSCVEAIVEAAPKTINNDDYNYGSALLTAIMKDKGALARKLLTAGAKTTWYSNDNENYGLHWAVKNKNLGLITALVKANADLNQCNKENRTPLELAAGLEYWDGVDTLVREAKANNANLNHIDSIIIDAIKADRDSTVAQLLNKSVDNTWHTSSDRNFALHWAVKKNNNYIINLLINHKFDLSQTNKANQTAMHLAASLGQWDCVETIARAASTNDKDTYQYGEALLAAIKKDRVTTAEILLKAKTPVTLDENHYLHAAVLQGNSAMVKLILQYGVKSSNTNHEGKTPLELACEQKKWSCAEVLLQDKNFKMRDHANAGLAFINAIKASELEIADMLCRNGAPITERSKPSGNTSLHWAVELCNHPGDNSKVISYLLALGLSLTAVNSNNETPIELACRLGKWNCVQFLLEQEQKNHAPRIDALHYQNALLHAVRQGNFTITKLN